jgi:transcriptional regulator with XRE-family HTH domain
MAKKPRSPAVTDVQQTLAERVRMARLNQKWTRPRLAELSGVNQYTLKRFELTGEISLCDFAALCETLNALDSLNGVLKPRLRVNVDNWQIEQPAQRQRGKKTNSLIDAMVEETQ